MSNNFTKIRDTLYDSRIFSTVVSQGIFPDTFKVYTSTIDLTQIDFGLEINPVTDNTTGEQIVLAEGTQVLIVRGGVSVPTEPPPKFSGILVGLSNMPTASPDEILTPNVNGVTLNMSGLPTLFDVNGGIVGPTNRYVVIQTVITTPPPIVSGTLELVIIVV